MLNRNKNKPNTTKAEKLTHVGIHPSSFIAVLSISTPYVSGNISDNGLIATGICVNGINKPHKNIIGTLKKFEKVCASNTSLTDTAISSPRKVDVTDIRITLTIA